RLALEKREHRFAKPVRELVVGNRAEKRLAGPHERIFVPFRPDKNRRGREGNASGTYVPFSFREVYLYQSVQIRKKSTFRRKADAKICNIAALTDAESV
ncbi:hypothetical protein ALC62_02365, partial [Cyphomyrmex costatus]